MQGCNTARPQPVAQQEDELRCRAVDGWQLGIVNPVQNSVERGGNSRVGEKRFRHGGVGRAGCGKTIAVPQIAVEVVFEQRPADQPADSEGDGPEEQAVERERFVTPVAVQEEAEYRQAGPGHQAEEDGQVGFAGRPRQKGEGGVAQGTAQADRVHQPARLHARLPTPVCAGSRLKHIPPGTTGRYVLMIRRVSVPRRPSGSVR